MKHRRADVSAGVGVIRSPSMKRIFVAVAVSAVAVTAVLAQVDINALGPQVGQPAVAFRLTDQRGVARTLDTVAGPKGTMLVFFRSADW